MDRSGFEKYPSKMGRIDQARMPNRDGRIGGRTGSQKPASRHKPMDHWSGDFPLRVAEMLFNSLPFLYAFLPISYLVFAATKAQRYAWLTITGYVFYAFWNPKYTLLMARQRSSAMAPD